jgi:hypothetical protein
MLAYAYLAVWDWDVQRFIPHLHYNAGNVEIMPICPIRRSKLQYLLEINEKPMTAK